MEKNHNLQTFLYACTYIYFSFDNTILTKESTTAAISAVPKPATLNPLTKLLINIIKKALITKVNNPNVIKFTGSVKITKIGFNKSVSIPHTTAITTNTEKFAIAIPGTKIH